MSGDIDVTVWAPNPLPETHGAVGFVALEHDLAMSLIDSDAVQDPRHGALHLREIGSPLVLPPDPGDPPIEQPGAKRAGARKAK